MSATLQQPEHHLAISSITNNHAWPQVLDDKIQLLFKGRVNAGEC
jgi:hypothetical protein